MLYLLKNVEKATFIFRESHNIYFHNYYCDFLKLFLIKTLSIKKVFSRIH